MNKFKKIIEKYLIDDFKRTTLWEWVSLFFLAFATLCCYLLYWFVGY